MVNSNAPVTGRPLVLVKTILRPGARYNFARVASFSVFGRLKYAAWIPSDLKAALLVSFPNARLLVCDHCPSAPTTRSYRFFSPFENVTSTSSLSR